jgi:signal transduction histidine kinase
MRRLQRVSRAYLWATAVVALAIVTPTFLIALRLPAMSGWVEHTYLVILQLDTIEDRVLDAESARRDYLLQRNEADREFFATAVRATMVAVSELQGLINDNGNQMRRHARLQEIIERSFATMDASMRETNLDLNAPAQLTFRQDIRDLKVQLVRLFGQMKTDERNLLAARMASSNAQIRRVTIASGLTGVTALFLILGAAFFVDSEVKRRLRAEEALASSNAVLESRVEQRTAELRQAMVLAEAASLAKSTFLANMSHELRNPLNSIIGFSELLTNQIDPNSSPKLVRYAENTLNSGRHLLHLVSEILDLQKIEAGTLELRPQAVDVRSILNQCRAAIEPVAARKGVSLSLEVGSADDAQDPLPRVRADSAKFRQIVDNLLSNAVKFANEQGHVWMTARVVQPERATAMESNDEFAVEVAVADDGIGIHKDEQERIFERFVQVDPSEGRREQGAGLGLAVARRLVELHGGTLLVESQPGHGSCFRFRVPVMAAEPREANVDG